MLIKFGIWEIDEKFGLVGKVGYDYNIHSHRLWETTKVGEHELWSWLIHLSEKTWTTPDNVNDLNTAFLFAQDYFKKEKPKNVPNVSTAQTIYVQRQLISLLDYEAKTENDILTSTDLKEATMNWMRGRSNLSFLDI